jgi:hypothetical protein
MLLKTTGRRESNIVEEKQVAIFNSIASFPDNRSPMKLVKFSGQFKSKEKP